MRALSIITHLIKYLIKPCIALLIVGVTVGVIDCLAADLSVIPANNSALIERQLPLVLWLLFIGYGFGSISYSGILYYCTREKIYLHFSAMLIIFMLSPILDNDSSRQYFEFHSIWLNRLNIILLGMAFTTFVAFMKQFLFLSINFQDLFPNLTRLMDFFTWGGVVISVCGLFLPPAILTEIYRYFVVLGIVVLFCTMPIWYSVIKRLYLFVSTVMLVCIFTLLDFLQKLAWLPELYLGNIPLNNHLLAPSLMMAFLSFVLLITDHINQERYKRLEVQQTAIKHLNNFQRLYENAAEGLFSMLLDGRIINYNPACARLLARPETRQDQQGEESIFFSDYIMDSQDWQAIRQQLQRQGSVAHRELVLNSTGGLPSRWVILSAQTNDDAGKPIIEGSLIDITERKQYELKLQYLSEHDSLTQLRNRASLEQQLQQALLTVNTGSAASHALLFLDLDQFKVINDTCGHPAGDECLRQIAGILRRHVHQSDTIARLGGDEFCLLLADRNENEALVIAECIRADMENHQFVWQARFFRTTASIGVIALDPRMESVERILSLADMACYAAKEAGRNRIMLSSQSTLATRRQLSQMETATSLACALQEGQLRLYRQAIAALDNEAESNLCHYEILTRLPEGGRFLPPGNFLPAAQRFDLLIPLDRWVIQQACSWLSSQVNTRLTINLSLASLNDSSLLDFLKTTMSANHIAPASLCFDINDINNVNNKQNLLNNLQQLADLGILLALDDFGSGVSSLEALKHLPVHYIKIEGRYIRSLLTDPINLAMVRAVVDIAHAMGKTVVAEAVEDAVTLEKLRYLKVDYAQGFYFDEPAPLLPMPITVTAEGSQAQYAM